MKRRKKIPRIIWLLWYQGKSKAPYVVKHCIDSWVRENPGWEVIVLDESNIGEYISSDSQFEKLTSLPLTEQSNFVRLFLLSEHGGIWADATTFCTSPLDDWIDEHTMSGFFAFHKPGKDRLLSTWFLACEKGCQIIPKWRDRYISFFKYNNFDIEGESQKKQIKVLAKLFNQSDKVTKYWFSPLVTKVLKIYPYFIIHYMFERLVATDLECKDIWDKTKKVNANGPHRIQFIGLLFTAGEDIKKEIDEKRIPLYKLTWKYDHHKYSSSSVLYYLLEDKH